MNALDKQHVTFKCNICGTDQNVDIARLTREEPSCETCGSTVRMRSIVQVLTRELFGKSMTIAEIDPPRPDIVGIGMSCWDGYAAPLAHRIAFRNTYYHQEPRVDITDIRADMVGTLDFIVSTDVFEHVEPPVSRAFVNARRLLKRASKSQPGGVFVFTVPYFHPGEEGVVTTENFPGLHKYTVIKQDGAEPILRNVRKDGSIEYFYHLCYHGGPGETLEMRRFSEWSVLEELKAAGFNDITTYRNDDLEFGIRWPFRCSAPIAARVVKRWSKEVTINIR